MIIVMTLSGDPGRNTTSVNFVGPDAGCPKRRKRFSLHLRPNNTSEDGVLLPSRVARPSDKVEFADFAYAFSKQTGSDLGETILRRRLSIQAA